MDEYELFTSKSFIKFMSNPLTIMVFGYWIMERAKKYLDNGYICPALFLGLMGTRFIVDGFSMGIDKMFYIRNDK